MNLHNRLLKLCFASILIVSIFSSNPSLGINNTPYPIDLVKIKILGINDFHGQISTGRMFNKRPVGSAPVLAAYLRQAELGMENKTLIALMGDVTGASPPASSLLHDEPTILFFNTLANANCKTTARMNPACNIVSTVGNHEFDKGQTAMLNEMRGTNQEPTHKWIALPHYPGAVFPYVSANIIDEKTGKTLFPPYVIKYVDGIPIAFIGAILKDAPDVILSSKIQGIKFLNEADAINHYIPEIKKLGVHVIVVLIHQGGNQTSFKGNTRTTANIKGPIVDVVNRLDDSVDVVMAGHTHQFLNAFVPNQHGVKILVTQANSYGSDFAEVNLLINRKNLSVIHKSARIITAYADQAPGNKPDLQAQKILTLAENNVAPLINRHVGTLKNDLLRVDNTAGESNLGDLIADAFRSSMKTDLAIVNPGGIRADLFAGDITWGKLYAVLPFSNFAVKMKLKGNDIYALLEQQWTANGIIMLQISGINYTYDLTKPIGARVLAVYHANQLIQRNVTYTVATNNFLADGGDGFSIMKKGVILSNGDTSIEVLDHYVKGLAQPFAEKYDGRISLATRDSH